MDDTPHHRRPADQNPPMQSESETEAGLFVSGDEIMRELRESIARMEVRVVAAGRADVKPGSSPRR
jgi:hypothetical protein